MWSGELFYKIFVQVDFSFLKLQWKANFKFEFQYSGILKNEKPISSMFCVSISVAIFKTRIRQMRRTWWTRILIRI